LQITEYEAAASLHENFVLLYTSLGFEVQNNGENLQNYCSVIRRKQGRKKKKLRVIEIVESADA